MAPTNGKPSVPPKRNPPERRPAEALEELRAIIVGPEQAALRSQYEELAEHQADLNGKVEALAEHLTDPQKQVEAVAGSLAEAVVLRTRSDRQSSSRQLEAAVKPVVERTIQASVRENPQTLAAAIYPVIMPALRKAIAQALDKMLQQINRALEHRLSPQSLRWRLEAARTGTSYAEVVLLHTLEYRVEQIFLIHKETGLLLLHASAIPETARDADVISGMLTAIQDFIKDSFDTVEGDALDTIQVGARKVWIEQSPFAVLAAVIRGIPPVELHTLLQETLETIHATHLLDLRNFDGDDTPFEVSRPVLENALLAQYKRKAGRGIGRWWLVLLLLAVLAALFFWWRNSTRWDRLVDRYEAEPGLVVTHADNDRIEGLRDPLAAEPASLLGCTPDGFLSYCHLDADEIDFAWEPFISPHPRLAEQRARQLLNPPEDIELSVSDNNVLRISGSAPQSWIDDAQRLAPFTPGISQVDFSAVAGPPLETVVEQLENARFDYAPGITTIAPAESLRLIQMVSNLAALDRHMAVQNRTAKVHIRGYVSPDGSLLTNRLIAEGRAANVLRLLQEEATRQGVDFSNRLSFQTSGIPPNADPNVLPGSSPSSPDIATNRFVTLDITLRDP